MMKNNLTIATIQPMFAKSNRGCDRRSLRLWRDMLKHAHLVYENISDLLAVSSSSELDYTVSLFCIYHRRFF